MITTMLLAARGRGPACVTMTTYICRDISISLRWGYGCRRCRCGERCYRCYVGFCACGDYCDRNVTSMMNAVGLDNDGRYDWKAM